MDDLSDDEWVTQYVFEGSRPRNMPRPSDHDGLSLLRGRLDIVDAARYVRFQVHAPWEGDSVRYGLIGSLRARGFIVTLTPSRRIPIHISVCCEAQWVEEDRHRFDSCFEANHFPDGGS